MHAISDGILYNRLLYGRQRAEDLQTGDEVGVYMHEGFLYAGKGARSAMGSAVMDAKAGEDIGIARLNGIIFHTEGLMHVCKIPRV